MPCMGSERLSTWGAFLPVDKSWNICVEQLGAPNCYDHMTFRPLVLQLCSNVAQTLDSPPLASKPL